MAALAGYTLPPGSCLYQDKGFQGFFRPGITIVQPKKTPRTYCNKCLLRVVEDPFGCYDVSRYDGDYDRMMKGTMAVFKPSL
jgi:hypothetical protein